MTTMLIFQLHYANCNAFLCRVWAPSIFPAASPATFTHECYAGHCKLLTIHSRVHLYLHTLPMLLFPLNEKASFLLHLIGIPSLKS